MILTLLLVQHVAGHVDVDGTDTSVVDRDDVRVVERHLIGTQARAARRAIEGAVAGLWPRAERACALILYT
jgi:hypothetical protein